MNTHDNIRSPGILILSAPSGAGKTSLARALAASRDDVALTVSHTTRKKRPGEVDSVHYYFVDDATFEKMIAENQFIEYAKVFNHYYGTSVTAMKSLIAAGKHAILDIDWQGARNVRKLFPNAVSVFVMPPSIEVLEQRLRQRQQDCDEVIRRRMQAAKEQMSHKDEFGIIVVNDVFEDALEKIASLLDRLKPVE